MRTHIGPIVQIFHGPWELSDTISYFSHCCTKQCTSIHLPIFYPVTSNIPRSVFVQATVGLSVALEAHKGCPDGHPGWYNDETAASIVAWWAQKAQQKTAPNKGLSSWSHLVCCLYLLLPNISNSWNLNVIHSFKIQVSLHTTLAQQCVAGFQALAKTPRPYVKSKCQSNMLSKFTD